MGIDTCTVHIISHYSVTLCLAIHKVISAPILKRRIDSVLLSRVSATHIVRILMNHSVLRACIDGTNAANAERAFMLTCDIYIG